MYKNHICIYVEKYICACIYIYIGINVFKAIYIYIYIFCIENIQFLLYYNI